MQYTAKDKMRVLGFRHVPFEDFGHIRPTLERRGIAIQGVDLYQNPDQPVAWDSADGLVFMGGPMSANDDLAFLCRELDLITRAVSAGIPMLGVCLGSQLIAKALGATVYKNSFKEIGWAPLHWTAAAREDALFRDLASPESVFHWHGETFDLPPGAAWLAYSNSCRHQAFRAGANVYGLQFHLEVTPEMIADWLSEDLNAADIREVPSPIDPHAHAAHLAELAGLVFSRWADLLDPRR
jgi:GMP synthase (glutamine-hydrolysing)